MGEWEWGREGVRVEGDHLLWYEREGEVRFASGGAVAQAFADFLARGPWVERVPAGWPAVRAAGRRPRSG